MDVDRMCDRARKLTLTARHESSAFGDMQHTLHLPRTFPPQQLLCAVTSTPHTLRTSPLWMRCEGTSMLELTAPLSSSCTTVAVSGASRSSCTKHRVGAWHRVAGRVSTTRGVGRHGKGVGCARRARGGGGSWWVPCH